ncbi:MAG: hypothetical protein MUC28_03425 [Planctomycetes bacterium]|jgi:hypothetical protein|nr:hypothetical protein [Planctomycetota bacterium]
MKYFIIFLLAMFSCCLICAVHPAPVLAEDAKTKFIDGLFDTGSKAGYDVADSAFNYENEFADRIGKIIAIILSFLGVIFLLLMIYGGFTWMTARGNEQQIAKAKGILYNALIGLIVVLAAYAITAYFGEEIAKAVTG